MKTIGMSTMAIQRRSYRRPRKNEGTRSPKEKSSGLNTKKVINLEIVKMSKKIMNRLTTHKMVLGNFNLINMFLAVAATLEKGYKKTQFYGI